MLTGTTTTRPAVASDIKAFYGELPATSVRAWVLEIGGEVVGIAGYRRDGNYMVVFSDVKPDVPKMTIWRKAREFMAMLDFEAFCQCTETSGPFLERLGWERVSENVFRFAKV